MYIYKITRKKKMLTFGYYFWLTYTFIFGAIGHEDLKRNSA
jgi:hypothetical protein